MVAGWSQAARPERGARGARNVAGRAVKLQAARTRGDAAHGATPRRRTAGQRGVANRESRERFASWARGRRILRRSGTAQQRMPHHREPIVRSEVIARDVAWSAARSQAVCKGKRFAWESPAPLPALCNIDAGPRRTAGQQGIANGEPRTRFANKARCARLLDNCGATHQCGPHHHNPQGRSKTRAKRGVAQRAAGPQAACAGRRRNG